MATTYTGWKDLPTLQSKEMLSELMEAKKYQKAALLISETGLGKTHTIKLYTKKNPDHTYVIVAGGSFKPVDLVNALLYELDITEWRTKTNLHQKIMLIADRLEEISNTGAKPIIIIDEAENIKPAGLQMIKEMYDAIIDYCSITLIGTSQILDSIHNHRNKNRQSVPQLWRRFKAGKRDISPLDKARDFKQFFQLYIPTDLDLQDLIMEVCENYGELHDHLDPVLRYASLNSKPVTEQLFRLIHKLPPSRKLKKIA